jgi:hypothetical protein
LIAILLEEASRLSIFHLARTNAPVSTISLSATTTASSTIRRDRTELCLFSYLSPVYKHSEAFRYHFPEAGSHFGLDLLEHFFGFLSHVPPSLQLHSWAAVWYFLLCLFLTLRIPGHRSFPSTALRSAVGTFFNVTAGLCCAVLTSRRIFPFFTECFLPYAEPCSVSCLAMSRIALGQPLVPDRARREDCGQQWEVQARKMIFGYVHACFCYRGM